MTVPRINYLSNKELLIEIHKSKLTYCSLVNSDLQDDNYKYYDIIVGNLKDITEDVIKEARDVRAQRIYKQKRESLVEMGFKSSEIKLEVEPEKVKTEDIVFRVMTSEHIPVLKDKKKKKVKSQDNDELVEYEESEVRSRVCFPPFKHYIQKDDEFVEVLRSHWKNGRFDPDCGRLTNRLAMMFMKLVDRYSQRGNWRGYTYVDEMKSQALLQLSQIGLQFDESRSATPNPFAYYTAAITNSFTRVLNIEKKNQNIRDDLLQSYGHSPSYTRQVNHEYKMREMEKNYREET